MLMTEAVAWAVVLGVTAVSVALMWLVNRAAKPGREDRVWLRAGQRLGAAARPRPVCRMPLAGATCR